MSKINSVDEFDALILNKVKEMMSDDPYEFDDYESAEEVLQTIKDGSWSSSCPYLNKTIRKENFPTEMIESCKTGYLWQGECCDYVDDDVQFIKDVVDKKDLPRDIFYSDVNINKQGCTGCWTFNYYYVVAWLIDNEVFWKM